MQPRVGAIPFAGSGAPMRVGGWTGLPEQRPVDALALALFSDAWFPPSFIALDSPAVSPTIDLTIHFRQPISACDCEPAALCLGVFETRLLHDGLFEEDGVIWAPDGAVLAQSRQLGIIMPTDKPVLQPRAVLERRGRGLISIHPERPTTTLPASTQIHHDHIETGAKRMSNYTAKHVKDMEAAFGGGFVKARAELGVTSFGMQVIRMPADYGDYPEHDHEHDGQEEVYVTLKGSGWIEIDGERVDLGPDMFVRVAGGVNARSTRAPRACRCSCSAAAPGRPTRYRDDRADRGVAR